MSAVDHPTNIPVRNRKSPIRVMLVDDSIVARSIFERILVQSDEIEIAFQADSCAEALDYLQIHDVDIILLDIEMPHRSGLDALPELIARSNGAPVMILSSFAEENGPAAIKALSLGACDTLAKPGRTGFSGKFSEILREKVIRFGRLNQSAERGLDGDKDTTVKFKFVNPACIAIGASTGGIPVIFDAIASIDRKITCPIFITQHLPETFMPFFARQLGAQTHRMVHIAECGEEVLPNHIYVAPGGAHLVCRRQDGKIILDHLMHYSASKYCPSVDVMMSSVAECYGRSALAIILSGMGNDGIVGVRLLAQQQAQIIAQDQESSVVWGMPGAVVREGLASTILSSTRISALLARGGA